MLKLSFFEASSKMTEQVLRDDLQQSSLLMMEEEMITGEEVCLKCSESVFTPCLNCLTGNKRILKPSKSGNRTV